MPKDIPQVGPFQREWLTNARDPNSKFCMNPVTGEYFMLGLDPTGPHKDRAVRALEARLQHAEQKASGMPDLPLNGRKYDGTWKWQSARHYLVDPQFSTNRIF
jgi:hypothetical protein